MKIRKGFILVALFLLTGCVIQPLRVTKTASGFPEALINTDDFDRVKYQIVAEMQTIGFLLKDDSKYRVSFTKELMGVDVGYPRWLSSAKSLRAEIIYSLSQMQKGIRVILFSSVICTYDSQGRVLKQEDMKDNNVWFNYFYNILQKIKANIESVQNKF